MVIKMYWTELKVKVRYNEVDRMNVVHNSNYFIYQEIGKNEYLDIIKLSGKLSDENGIFSPITSNTMNYVKPATFDEDIFVRIALYKITGVQITYISGIYNKDEELLAYGKISNCITDTNMKPLSIKKTCLEDYEKLKENECISAIGNNLTKKIIDDFFKNKKYMIKK